MLSFQNKYFYPIFVMNSMKKYQSQKPFFLRPFNSRVKAKWCVVLLLSFLINVEAFGQKNNLVIEGTTPKLYLIHKIAPKENFFSIGRMYNIPAKEIAAYNNLQFENGLSIGQSIKIPLEETNFLQSGPAPAGEVLIPVYHSVQPKEGLYRMSINYNKVPLSVIKKWNHLQSDEVSVGTKLIVGYLKVQKNESPLAATAGKTEIDIPAESTEQPKNTPPVNPDADHDRLPPVKKPDDNNENKEVATQHPDDQKTVNTVSTGSSINFSGGYFKKLYTDQVEKQTPINATGSAATFKSTSGWKDGKYYCFINDAPPGAIVKITNIATNKSVYAKVLDAIPDIKQNSGLSIILSNAAAEELGASPDTKFDCALSYIK
jgi:LysM repeat protein